jgi:putative cardiolipin synthase
VRSYRTWVCFLLACLASACSSLPPAADVPKSQSSALERPETTQLGKTFAATARQRPGESGFRMLPAPQDGFLVRMQLLRNAQRTVDVQYFLFEDGVTGTLITNAMREAAARGVRVRLLIDDADFARRGAQLAALDTHPNVEVRIFNPFSYRGSSVAVRAVEFMLNKARLNYRMHNKLFVVDNAAALVGGRNVGDKYFVPRADWGIEDYDIFSVGPVVPALSRTFDDYWKSSLSIPLRNLPPAPPQEESDGNDPGPDRGQYARKAEAGEPLAGMLSGRLPLFWGRAQVICDDPERKLSEGGDGRGTPMERALGDAAGAVRSELIMVSPYFIPGQDGLQQLRGLRERNVRVRVMTKSLESLAGAGELMAHAAYARYRRPLLESGVALHELMPPRKGPPPPEQEGADKVSGEGHFALHGKLFVFDRQRIFIGSMNYDPRSRYLNTELGLIIESPQLARQAAARFEALAGGKSSYTLGLEDSRMLWRSNDVATDQEPARDARQRMQLALYSMLPLDDEL